METLSLFKRNSRETKDYANDGLITSISKPMAAGTFAITAMFLTLLLWGGLAPLKSAAIASGKVVSAGKNKIIQHLEGGIINEIFVKEGSLVKKGTPLISLNDSSSEALTEILIHNYYELLAKQGRLISERDNKKSPDFSELKESGIQEKEMQELIKAQTEIFHVRKKSYQEQIEILKAQIGQMKSEIQGLESQEKYLKESMAISLEQLSLYESLLEKGYTPKMKVMEINKSANEQKAQIAEMVSEIAKVKQMIGETQLSILNTETQRYNQIITEISQGQANITELKEKISAAEDILDRTIIRAPADGIVTGLKYHTVGGVIAPGQEILQIVPENDSMIVEAKLSLTDIDVVRKDMDVFVHLSAFKPRQLPLLKGKVLYISADSFPDHATGASFYNVQVKIDNVPPDLKLQSGMPVEVYITTGQRTMLSYLLYSITTAKLKAFKED